MIVSVRNQPIVFHEKDTETGACTSEAFCQPVQQHDVLCFQHRQTSCLPQLLCSPDFSELGPELITDGDFYGNPYGVAGWDFSESDWYWDDAGRKLCIILDGGYGEVQYNIVLDPDCTQMKFSFTVSDLTEDDNNELIVTLPDANTVTITENGDYEYIVDPGPTIKFSPEPNFDGCIDNVSLRCVAECWTILTESESATNGGLQFNIPGVCKPESIAVEFQETTGTLVSGKYYQVWIETDSISSGSVEFFLGGVSIGTIDENGIFALYGTSGGTKFSFVMSDDFAGCIKSINVYQLSNDYELTLLTTNDIELVELDAEIRYTRDLIEVCIEVTPEFLASFPDFSSPQRYCWKMVLESPDDGELVTNGSFTLGTGQTLDTNYDIQDDDNFDIVGANGSAIYQGGDGYLSQNLAGQGPPGLVPGTEYYVSFDIVCLKGETTFDSFVITLGSDSGNNGGELVFGAEDYPASVGHYVYKVTAGSDGDFISIYFTDDYGLEKLCITNLSVRLTACAKQTLESNCIAYKEVADGTKLFTACNEEGESFGFDWSTGFKLHARVPASMIGPKYSSPEDETYLYSDGRRDRTFARLEKKFDLTVGPVGELQHDYIRTMLKCDVLYIEDGYQLLNRYVCLDGEYVPEWPKAMPLTSEARVEIQRYDNAIFNTNCK